MALISRLQATHALVKRKGSEGLTLNGRVDMVQGIYGPVLFTIFFSQAIDDHLSEHAFIYRSCIDDQRGR